MFTSVTNNLRCYVIINHSLFFLHKNSELILLKKKQFFLYISYLKNLDQLDTVKNVCFLTFFFLYKLNKQIYLWETLNRLYFNI